MAPKTAKKTESKTVGKSEGKKGKRVPTPYILFCSEKRAEVKESNPSASFGEIGKILGKMWSALDEKGKAVSS